MEVKIGVQHAGRELVLECDQTPEAIEQAVSAALGGKSNILALEDTKGRRVLVPADRLAYIEINEQVERRVGFTVKS